MILANHEVYAKLCRGFVNHGQMSFDRAVVSSNARNSELSAALGIAHLECLNQILDIRSNIAECVYSALRFPLSSPMIPLGTFWNHQSLPIICSSADEAEALMALFKKNLLLADWL